MLHSNPDSDPAPRSGSRRTKSDKYQSLSEQCDDCQYEMFMNSLMKDCTMITDGAAFMARVASASVSREIREPAETWMSCLACFLHNTMKAVLANTNKSSVLQVDLQDFRSVK